jgi:hypothetical protein
MDLYKLTLSEPESDFVLDYFISGTAGDKIGNRVKNLIDGLLDKPKIISIHAERWALKKEGDPVVWCEVLNRNWPPHEMFDCVDTWETEYAYINIKTLRLWMD